MQNSDEAYTPPVIMASVRAYFAGRIDLDPYSCAAANEIVQARRYHTRADDGHTAPWYGARNVWINPPYSRGHMPRVVGRVCYHVSDVPSAQVLLLTNQDTGTAWGRRLLDVARVVVLLRQRTKFYGPGGGPSAKRSQMIWVLGHGLDRQRLHHLSELGSVMETI